MLFELIFKQSSSAQETSKVRKECQSININESIRISMKISSPKEEYTVGKGGGTLVIGLVDISR